LDKLRQILSISTINSPKSPVTPNSNKTYNATKINALQLKYHFIRKNQIHYTPKYNKFRTLENKKNAAPSYNGAAKHEYLYNFITISNSALFLSTNKCRYMYQIYRYEIRNRLVFALFFYTASALHRHSRR